MTDDMMTIRRHHATEAPTC